MSSADDISLIVQQCKEKVDLGSIKQAEEYYYHSLPQCVIDAVFSIGVRYAGIIKTVRNYCEYFGVITYSSKRVSEVEQTSITRFLTLIHDFSPEELAGQVFKNRQRTSPRNGILKAEAVRLFAEVLTLHEVNYLQDIPKILGKEQFEKDIAQIPGQRSGLSTRYFYMLAGSDDFIKPDRMIRRFIYAAINRELSMQESQVVLVNACRVLQKEFPNLTQDY